MEFNLCLGQDARAGVWTNISICLRDLNLSEMRSTKKCASNRALVHVFAEQAHIITAWL